VNNIKKCIPLILLVVFTMVVFCFFELEDFIGFKNYLIQITSENIYLAVVVFSFVYIFSVAVSLPIATLLTVTAGFLFGFILGVAIVVISATVGASIIFLIVRYSLGKKNLFDMAKDKSSLKKIQNNIKKNEVNYLLFVRLVPIFPFALVNIAPATIGVKFRTYFWTTLAGITPVTAIYVYLGSQAEQINEINDLFSIEILIVLILLGGLSITPIFLKKHKGKQKK